MAPVKELIVKSLEELKEKDLKKFQWHLEIDHECISKSDMETADRLDTVDKLVACFGPEGAVKITVKTLRKMNQNHLAKQLENKHKPDNNKAILHDYTKTSIWLKEKLTKDYEKIFIGNAEKGHKQYLNDIYTDLFVVQNETGGTVNDHEVIQIQVKNHNQLKDKERSIKCNDMFKVQPDNGRQNRKVLTMGIAGVGKTVSVYKFILDWAEKENQEIIFIFPFLFRRLNLIKKEEEYSLIELINKYFFSSPGELASLPEGDGKVMFIFDGLDECRFPLNFEDDDDLKDVNKKTSVNKIITNLIKRNLVPSALIWITSRPAAASLVPRNYIDQMTEVCGFNDEQKEQYFEKNCPGLAKNIIDHIKKSRSLYIMCHIPVFCWISLTVLKPLLAQGSNVKTPTTLTGMYTNFLLTQQQQMKNKNPDKKNPKDTSFDEIIQKLGKLAFQKLKKGELIFYKEDIEKCGLCAHKGLVLSGLCTKIFKEDQVISEEKVYSFVHLSVQEFLAALYVFFNFKCSRRNAFFEFLGKGKTFFTKPLFKLHKDEINKALQSSNGHLDLFLRFLLGLSLECNQRALKGLLPRLKPEPENLKQTSDYIKQKIEREKSAERTINLFHCLSELKDDFVEELQKKLTSGHLELQSLSTAQWSGLVFVLLMSEETQEMFELQKYRRSDEALMRLLPVIKNTRRALLQCSNLTDQSCQSLSSALQSSSYFLRDLDISSNYLQDSGVRLLSDGLKSSNCQLEILRLQGCSLTAQSCDSLSSALQLNSALRELDLSNNDLQDSGVKFISDGLRSSNCQLEKLSLQCCNLTAVSCESLSLSLQSSNVLKELDLSNNDLQDSGVRLLSDGLKSSNCKLEILRLSGCMVTEEGCGYLSSALSSNNSNPIELDLSYNHPGDSGVKMISDKLDKIKSVCVDHGEEGMIKAGLKKYACFLTLDPNTVHTDLQLSKNNTEVKNEKQSNSDHESEENKSVLYPDHPDRFDYYHQVLCSESVCGRCYWETEWSGDKDVCISVSYKSIKRKGSGDECWFGSNDQSWSLFCSPHSYSFWHNKLKTDSPVKPFTRSGVNGERVCRTGVYVDSSAGTLSFYSIDINTMSLIHTAQTKFAEPLYPGFGVDPGSSVKLHYDTDSTHNSMHS